MTSHILLFQQHRWHVLRNAMSLLMAHSLLRLVTILACSLVIWGLIFGLSWTGFHELKARWNVDLDLHLIDTVLALLFFTLSVMLTFSTGLIIYSSLFASAESQFLMALPVPDDHVFAYRLQGGIGFSSWAFVLLGSPILIAYGLEIGDGAPWYYYLVMPLFFVGFTLMPGALGAVACLLLVNFLPRHRMQVLIGIAIVLLVVVGFWGVSWYRQAVQSPHARSWFEDLISELSILSRSWVPFQWAARGLKLAALGKPVDMLWYFALVWSNGLMAYIVTVWLGKRLYRRGLNRVATGGTLRRRYGGAWLDQLVTRIVFFLDPQTRQLLVKDVRTFRRDPAHWAQILIFMGFATLGLSVVRPFYEQEMGPEAKHWISLLTLFAAALLLCSYTGRFIFPMLSLEGKKFWILGLLPLDRARLVWGKFTFSATGCVAAGVFFAIFSDMMLGMPAMIVITHAVTIAVLALALSGVSVGLGACLPNFRETDPSKLAMSFGGLVNVIAGLLLMMLLIALMAVPIHVVRALHPEIPLRVTDIAWWAWASFLTGLVLGVAFAVIPLRAGYRALRSMEF
jgi:ABC-2 type transport system permease protein